MKIILSLLLFFLTVTAQVNYKAKSKYKMADDGKKIYKSIVKNVKCKMKTIKMYDPEATARNEARKKELNAHSLEVQQNFTAKEDLKEVSVSKETISTDTSPASFFDNLNKTNTKTIDME